MADETEKQVDGDDAAAQPSNAWGASISEERQAELRALAERQWEWAAQPEATRGNSLFKDVWLKGADVSWLALQSLERTDDDAAMTPAQFASHPKAQPVILRALYMDFDHWPSVPNLHLEGATLRGAHLEGAHIRGAHLEHATLREAHLEGANLRQAHLGGANLQGAHLVETRLEEAHLGGANLRGAHLVEARLEEAHLEGAYLERAHLERAHLEGVHLASSYLQEARLNEAHLEGAYLERAHLERAHLDGANLKRTRLERADLTEALLAGTDLRRARLVETNLTGATFDKTSHLNGAVLTGATLDQVTYDGVNLTVVDWSLVPVLGDELTTRQRKDKDSKRKSRAKSLDEFTAAARAYRVLAVTLRSQGVNEDADRYAYRAQRMQRATLRLRRRYLPYLGSLFIDLLAGYGFRPERSLLVYLGVIFWFANFYVWASHGLFSMGLPPTHVQPLAWYEGLILSVSSFHGRGFQPFQNLNDPIAALAGMQAVLGLIIEVSFIATFTQRFFAR